MRAISGFQGVSNFMAIKTRCSNGSQEGCDYLPIHPESPKAYHVPDEEVLLSGFLFELGWARLVALFC